MSSNNFWKKIRILSKAFSPSLVLLVILLTICICYVNFRPTAMSKVTAKSDSENPIVLVAASWMSEEPAPHVKLDPFEAILDEWMDTVERESSGRVAFERYPAESLIKESDGWQAVKSGYCDIYIIMGVSYPEQFPLTNLMGLPDLFPNATVASAVIQELHDEDYISPEWAEVKVLWHAATSPSDVGSKEKIIKTLDDWKGLKVAVVGEPETATVRALGAIPVEIPKTEQYRALQNGLVDASWLELNGQVIFKFFEVAPYDTICFGGVRTLNYVMNLQTYQHLPPDIKEIFDRNSGLNWSIKTGSVFDESYRKAKEYLDRRVSPTYIPPDAELALWKECWNEIKQETLVQLDQQGFDSYGIMSRLNELSYEYSH